MSWASVYRLALHLLPAKLRRKHGRAMETLFARDLAQARTRGWLQTVRVGVANVWDVVRRAAYEQLRMSHGDANDLRRSQAQERWSMDVRSSQPTQVDLGHPPVLQPTGGQLVRRHATSFATSFMALTALLLASFARRHLPALGTAAATGSAIAKALLFAVPFTAALTLPMSVFVAVLWEFTRLRADGALAAAQQKRAGMRRLIFPVLGAALAVAGLEFVVTAEIVPRANERLVMVLAERPTAPSDRMMTLGELRAAMRTVGPATEPTALARAARYEIEIQKKFALPAACVVLAMVAMVVALCVPRGGAALVIGASLVVFSTYYVMLVTGESLANRLVLSPLIAMWGANALLVAAVLLAVSRRPGTLA